MTKSSQVNFLEPSDVKKTFIIIFRAWESCLTAFCGKIYIFPTNDSDFSVLAFLERFEIFIVFTVRTTLKKIVSLQIFSGGLEMIEINWSHLSDPLQDYNSRFECPTTSSETLKKCSKWVPVNHFRTSWKNL